MNYQEYLDLALSIYEDISPIFKEGFFKTNTIMWKHENDPVTEYDQKIEALVRELILKQYPEHIILGEEDGLQNNTGSDFEWIVDPIDGTANYIRSIPFVAFSLALSYKGQIIVSVVANPIIDECFWAVRGEGAYLNGQAISASSITDFKKSYINFGRYSRKYINEYHKINNTFQSVRNAGSAALVLAYVACGRMEGTVYPNLSPWDVAGGWLLVEEAGGNITNMDGSTFTLEEPSLLAGNKVTHPQLVSIFNTP